MRSLGALVVALLVLAGSSSAQAVVAASYPTPTVESKGSGARPGMPAVTKHATTFGKQPRIARGTGKPSKKLLVRDLVGGHGSKVGPNDTVEVRYVGVLYTNGKIIDSSWARGSAPLTFPLRDVIPGFAGGIVGMKVGERREMVIPPRMAYGSRKVSSIPANSTLVFVVDLVRIDRR